MIHSCAGGVIREKRCFDFAKVEIIATGEVRWYITKLPLLTAGDFVIVPYGRENKAEKAKVLRIDKNVSEQVSPVPARQAKEIISICEE